MSDESSIFTKVLSPELLKRAFKFHNEFAWTRPDAIHAIDRLEKAGIAILGVDVWVPSDGRPTVSPHFVYDWSVSQHDALPEWPKSAQEFVRTFHWDPDDSHCRDHEPYFNLAISDDEDWGTAASMSVAC